MLIFVAYVTVFLILSPFFSPSEPWNRHVSFLKGVSETKNGGLSQRLVLKKETRTMLACNIVIKVRLINGEMMVLILHMNIKKLIKQILDLAMQRR